MYKIITCNRGIIKSNKDKIEIDYTPNGSILTNTKVTESSNYEYWFDYKENDDGEIKISALNLIVDNVIYKNIDGVTINNNFCAIGTHEGYVTIERIR